MEGRFYIRPGDLSRPASSPGRAPLAARAEAFAGKEEHRLRNPRILTM